MSTVVERSETPRHSVAPGAAPVASRWRSALAMALLGSLLLWAAQPPLGLWPLAWLAPIPWLLIIRDRRPAGRREYFHLWLAGCAYWLAAIHWLRLPHWTTHFGWIALSLYMACYLPVFVGVARAAVQRLGWPLPLAAAVVWTGLELARGHLLTGFLMGALGHTQYRWLPLIQISDLVGSYGLDFLVMFGAASLACLVPGANRSRRFWLAPVAGAALLASALGYGYARLADEPGEPALRVGLIQGSIDSQLKAKPGHSRDIFEHYLALSMKAVEQDPNLDLIVWPETMYRSSLVTFDDTVVPPPEANMTVEQLKAALADQAQDSLAGMNYLAQRLGTALLLGVDTQAWHDDTIDRYNSAAFVDEQGRLQGRYDKMHRVMFGEYIPLAGYFPWLYQVTPLPVGLTPGAAPASFEIKGVRIAPSICYETVIPHTIRRHVVELREKYEEPDVLINLTNDGWFYGSSQLDMHLACGVLRAVECRKPLLIAANTGFSAHIDGSGRVLAQGPRRDSQVLIAEARLDARRSLYMTAGDWFAGLCLLASAVVLVLVRWRRPSAAASS